jgi:HPr kinase/phosphorylase
MNDDKITLHGVFMEVMQLGVLLTGASGVGKSELALELVSRGHRLIADDTPEFLLSTVTAAVEGRCPEMLYDFLEVRGLGIINVRAMFGSSAVMPRAQLNIILRLQDLDSEWPYPVDRLHASRDSVVVLGMEIPRITLPVAPGRNLAILAETAIRSHKLLLTGYDAVADFSQRQQSILQGES